MSKWHTKKLGEVAEFSRERICSADLTAANYVGVDCMVANLGGKNPSDHVPKSGKVTKYVAGDILQSNIRPYLKKAYFAHDEGGVSADVLVLRPRKEIMPKLLYYQTTTDEYFDYVMSGSKGVKMPRGDKAHIMDYIITIPPKRDQEAIIDILGDCDENLRKIEEAIERMKELKKGLMQQIFSQKLRFKADDGSDFPEWKSKRLKDVLNKNSRRNKEQLCTNVQSVSNRFGFVSQEELFEGRVIASKNLSNYFIIKKGMFAYNPSRIDVGSIAYKDDDNIAVVSPLYISFSGNQAMLDDKFLFDWFKSTEFTRQMNNMFEGSVRNTLSYEALSRMVITVPSLSEQKKIARFLVEADSQISILKAIHGEAVKQNKWLLNNLVTGKIRLPQFNKGEENE